MPYVSLTEREEATGTGQPEEGSASDSHAGTRAPARMRPIVAALSTVTQRVRAHRAGRAASDTRWEADGLAEKLAGGSTKVDVRTEQERAAPDVRGRSLWADGPASPADQWEYLRAGAWAPGEQHWSVETLGRIYGLLALAVTIAVAVPTWTVQRPSRLALAVVIGLIWWGATLADAPPVPPAPAAGGAP